MFIVKGNHDAESQITKKFCSPLSTPTKNQVPIAVLSTVAEERRAEASDLKGST